VFFVQPLVSRDRYADKTVLVRSVGKADRDSWERMRDALWPSPAREHAGEIERYFAGTLREPIEVLMAFDAQDKAIGLIELSIRAYAEGCATDRVAFIEGWRGGRPGYTRGSWLPSLLQSHCCRSHCNSGPAQCGRSWRR